MRMGRHSAGPGATSLWVRVLAVLLGICLLLSALQGALAGDNATRASSITAVVAEGLARAASDQTEDGMVQHCASCPYHQAAQLSSDPTLQTRLIAKVRFDLRNEIVSDRATAPPSRPPAA